MTVDAINRFFVLITHSLHVTLSVAFRTEKIPARYANGSTATLMPMVKKQNPFLNHWPQRAFRGRCGLPNG